MKILFIHEVNYRNKVIFEMHEFPELLALRGHDVTFFHFPESPDEPRRSARTTRETIRGRVHPETTITLVTPPTLGGGTVDRYVAPIIDVPALRREIADGGYDVIVLYAVPTTGWQTIALAKRHGVPVVFRALDVSHQIRETPLSGLIRRAERYVYRGATVLSANNPAMAAYCVAESGRTGPTSVDLPPVDLSHFEEQVDVDLHARLGLRPADEVILYMGSFFGFSGLDLLLESMAALFAENPRLRLVLVGGGELDAALRARAVELGVADRVVFTGVVPYAELPAYLKVADVAVNPFRPELVTHVALPHKILQYMAAGVPVVSTALDGIRGILGDDAGVTWVDSPEQVAAAALELIRSGPARRAEISATQSAVAKETFSMSASVDHFERLLESVG